MGCAKKQGQYSSLEWIPLRYMKLTVVIVLRLLTQQKEQIIHGGGWLEIHKKVNSFHGTLCRLTPLSLVSKK